MRNSIVADKLLRLVVIAIVMSILLLFAVGGVYAEHEFYISQLDEISGIDTTIGGIVPTTNFGTIDQLNVGEQNDVGGSLWRSLITFDLSSIPSTSIITSATLIFTIKADLSSNARDISVYRVLRDWSEGEVTWNKYNSFSSWTIPGVGSNGNDADLTNVWATTTFSASETVNTEKTFVFTAIGLTELQKIINNTYINYGWVVRVPGTALNDCYVFYSSSSVIEAYRPKLVIEYDIDVPTDTPTLTNTPTFTPTSTPTSISPLGVSGDFVDDNPIVMVLFGAGSVGGLLVFLGKRLVKGGL